MIAALRELLAVFGLLSVLYVYLSLRQRRNCRRRLNAEFDAGGVKGPRKDYIAKGMRAYEHSLRRKLILGVYVVPLAVVVTMIYVMNFM